MTKRSFLEKLKRRLSVLNEEERQDIIDEYKDIIAEKVKHGKTEEEAVSDFGDIDELVSEILSAYKIDPNVGKEETKHKTKDFLESGEELIKDGAKKLTEATDKIVNDFKEANTEITVELVFELILKGLCALVIMGIISLPFMLINSLGGHILDFTFYPLGTILKVVWKIIVSILYFGSCIFIVIALFKEYVKNPEGKNKSKHVSNKTNNEKKKIQEKSLQSKETIEEKENDIKPVQKKGNERATSHTLSHLFIILLKLFVIFTFLIPIWFLIIGLVVAFAILIYFLIKGISVIVLILGVIGLIILLGQLSNLLYNGLFNAYRIHVYPFLIALVFIVVGTFMTIDFVTGIDYIDAAPKLEQKMNHYEFTLNKPTMIAANNDQTEFILDNSLPDNVVAVDVAYYKDYVFLVKNEEDLDENYHIEFYQNQQNTGNKTYHLIMDNLKNNRFYNYNKIDEIKIKITCNEATKNLIRVD